MKRRVDMSEISDGKLYGLNDLVKAECGDCKGCFKCCTGMGSSIVLDPYDVYRLTTGLDRDFAFLLNNGYMELNMVDELIVPNIRMTKEERCPFLSKEGRCLIHALRPGNCRLFPLGRIYREEGRGFDYFLQIHECVNPARTKVKVKKWIDTPDIIKYTKFIEDWHYLAEEISEKAGQITDELAKRALMMRVLNTFFVEPYSADDFYRQYKERKEKFSATN